MSEDQPENSQPKNPADHLVGHRFQPGQSGNPGGRPKGRSITAILRELLDQVDPDTGETYAAGIAATMIRDAAAGSHKFAREVLDRTEGKVTQPVDVTSQGEQVQVHFYIPENHRDTPA